MRISFFGSALAAVIFFVGTTVWGGDATIDPAGDLSGGSYSIATNAFPNNAVVDVTNNVSLETPSPALSEAAVLQPQGNEHTSRELNLVTSTERIPEGAEPVIPPEHFVPPIGQRGALQTSTGSIQSQVAEPLDEYRYVTSIQNTETPPAREPAAEGSDRRSAGSPPETVQTQPTIFSPFRAPLISELERNKWYVQIAAYAQPNHVEDEINRIDASYPLTIQKIGTDTDPFFRVLLGPLNQGESAAMLQRIRSIGYTDAFVRRN